MSSGPVNGWREVPGPQRMTAWKPLEAWEDILREFDSVTIAFTVLRFFTDVVVVDDRGSGSDKGWLVEENVVLEVTVVL